MATFTYPWLLAAQFPLGLTVRKGPVILPLNSVSQSVFINSNFYITDTDQTITGIWTFTQAVTFLGGIEANRPWTTSCIDFFSTLTSNLQDQINTNHDSIIALLTFVEDMNTRFTRLITEWDGTTVCNGAYDALEIAFSILPGPDAGFIQKADSHSLQFTPPAPGSTIPLGCVHNVQIDAAGYTINTTPPNTVFDGQADATSYQFSFNSPYPNGYRSVYSSQMPCMSNLRVYMNPISDDFTGVTEPFYDVTNQLGLSDDLSTMLYGYSLSGYDFGAYAICQMTFAPILAIYYDYANTETIVPVTDPTQAWFYIVVI